MAEHDTESTAGLLRSVLEDTRDLIREELLLARTEVRQELAEARSAAVAFAASAAIATLGVTLLSIGGALAYAFGWPSWAGYGIVAIALLIVAAILVGYGRGQAKQIRALPRTRETIKENIAWIQNSSGRR